MAVFPGLAWHLLAVAPATQAAAGVRSAFVEHPAGVLAVLLGVLALIFWLTEHPFTGRLFRVVPALVFCYFVPTTLTTLGVLPDSSTLYQWVKDFILPASLLLLILALDLPAIIRLGPKALIMLLTGTASVVVGGPIALAVCHRWLPDDAWQGLTALSGSWIGGGANFVALGDIAGASDTMLAMMVVPDVLVANIWMGVLLFLAGRQHAIDRRTRANTEAIRVLERKLADFQARVSRPVSVPDLMVLLGLAFVASWVSYALGQYLYQQTVAVVRETAAVVLNDPLPAAAMHPIKLGHALDAALQSSPDLLNALPTGRRTLYHVCRFLSESIGASTWKYILVTTFGVLLSFTRARNLEGAGASKIGTVLLYLLVACIGAGANFVEIAREPYFFLTGLIWMAVHVVCMLAVGFLIRAPIFFVAVGSQANIGGAASAPVVAAAYHPALAPVGALLAVLGYVLGTYAGLVCMTLLKQVAGVS